MFSTFLRFENFRIEVLEKVKVEGNKHEEKIEAIPTLAKFTFSWEEKTMLSVSDGDGDKCFEAASRGWTEWGMLADREGLRWTGSRPCGSLGDHPGRGMAPAEVLIRRAARSRNKVAS